MLEKIGRDMAERSKTWINSMCPTDDEVSICWLLTEIDRLQEMLEQAKHNADPNKQQENN